jgi:hypothetical protein
VNFPSASFGGHQDCDEHLEDERWGQSFDETASGLIKFMITSKGDEE